MISDHLGGFRERRSCESLLSFTLQELSFSKEDGKQIDAVLLDFSKAFHKVSHQRHLHKLKHYGTHGNTLHCIKFPIRPYPVGTCLESRLNCCESPLRGFPGKCSLFSVNPILHQLHSRPIRVYVKIFADNSLLLFRKINKKTTWPFQIGISRNWSGEKQACWLI